MSKKQRKFKSHENVYGNRTINSAQVSKTFTPMKNVKFWKQLAENPEVLIEKAKRDMESSEWRRKNRLNEVSYKTKFNY
tara:strand:- start:174 stop:410 length:237 start_codon:yes stop_codon:yes gene_type:complete